MEIVSSFAEFHTEIEEFHPAATTKRKTTNKVDKAKTNSPVIDNIDEFPNIESTDSVENIHYPNNNTTTTILEKIPKVETDELGIWKDSDSDNNELDRDPFADIECDPYFALGDNNLPSDIVVTVQKDPESSIETDDIHRTTRSKRIRPPATSIPQNNPLECKLCLKILSTQTNLKSHVNICSISHKDGHLFCAICNRRYTRTSSLKFHNLNSHRRATEELLKPPNVYRVQFHCQFCPKKFVHKEPFRVHTESHVKNLDIAQNKANEQLQLNPYKCQECSSTFCSVTDLNHHVTEKHVEKVFKCPEPGCGKTFQTKTKLTYHFNSHSDWTPFKCPQPNCGKSFKYKQHLVVHTNCHSENNKFILNLGKTLKVEGDSVLAKYEELQNIGGDSDWNISISKPLQCEECLKPFLKNWQLNAHMRTVHCKKEPVKCPRPDCGKTFKHDINLKIHLKQMHSDKADRKGELFSCSYVDCERTFKYKSSLTTHVKEFHEGKVPFAAKCPHPGCNKAIRRKYLKIHMRTHTGERPFKCTAVENCSKTFIKPNDLKNHIMQKHKENVN